MYPPITIPHKILCYPKYPPVLHLFKPSLPSQMPGNHLYICHLSEYDFFHNVMNNYAVCCISDWLLLLSNINLRFIHVFARIDRLHGFLFIAEQHSVVWMYYSLVICSDIERILGSFQFLVIINKAAVNISILAFMRK